MANRAKKNNRINHLMQVRYNKDRAASEDGWRWAPLPKGWKDKIRKAKASAKRKEQK